MDIPKKTDTSLAEDMPDELVLHTITGAALVWTDGHVLGNGDVGAVVWGHAEQLFIGFSKHDVNNLTAAGPHGVRWKTTWMEARDRSMNGERGFWDNMETLNQGSSRLPCPLPCGRLTLELLRGVQVVGYEQQLSMLDAECRVLASPTSAGWSWGMRFEPIVARVYVHAERNLAVVELSSEIEQRVRWRFDGNPGEGLPQPEYSVKDNIARLDQPLPENEGYSVCIKAGSANFTASAGSEAASGMIEFGGRHGDATVFVTLASRRENGNPLELAEQILQEALSEESETLLETHRRWWSDFWRRSAIMYEDEQIARLWYMGLYSLASATRPDKSPPHLQGIWNQYDVPPWHADFHLNTNLQESQWLACPSNHPELQSALVRVLTEDWREELRSHARENIGAPGLAAPRAVDWLGRPLTGCIGGMEMSLTAWIAQHLWQQWRYTRDENLLREKVLPFLKEACEFYRYILVRDEGGTYHIMLSSSPEQVATDSSGQRYGVHGTDPAIDIAFISELFAAYVEGAELVGEASEFVDACRDVRDHLPELPTEEGVLIDLTVGFFHDGDRRGRFKLCHRHPSRLTPIHPCEIIGLHSTHEMLELGRRSFREFRSYGFDGITGWSEAWQINIAARLGLADEAEQYAHNLLEHFMHKGMLTSHNSTTGRYGMKGGPLFQIEALYGAAAGINEMLLQGTGFVLRLFPAVPKERSAAFENLRAPGAVLVSARKNGTEVTNVRITAEADGEIALANPWPGQNIRIFGEKIGTLTGDVVRWTAKAGQSFSLEPVRETNA
jgi:hypothetical protein